MRNYLCGYLIGNERNVDHDLDLREFHEVRAEQDCLYEEMLLMDAVKVVASHLVYITITLLYILIGREKGLTPAGTHQLI